MGQKNNEAAGFLTPAVTTAFLVITDSHNLRDYEPRYLLEELKELVATMGLQVQGSEIVHLKKINPRFFLGSGKTAEIIAKAKDLEVDCIIFNDDLSPSQQRNWEETSNLCVIDRQEVILDIFSARAATREAVIQVELARMQYSLPRLTRAWLHLSRQRGGTRGTRGEGETQLEMDRRYVENHISHLKQELLKVQQNRETMRKQRHSAQIPTASLIGYTNAGKSSLLNALSAADVFVEDKLFATLDPTTRRIELEGGSKFLLTDTVGFIRKLPHHLVESFKSTLEETRYADFLIHVLDASNPEVFHHYQTTISVLEELGVSDKPLLTLFNKIDLVSDDLYLLPFQQLDLQRVSLSIKTGQGMNLLLAALDKLLYDHLRPLSYRLPTSRYDLVSLIHRNGNIIEEKYEGDLVCITARLPRDLQNRLREFVADSGFLTQKRETI